MNAIRTKSASSASLECRRFELYAFRFNITTTHQNFVQCITAIRALKKYVQKLRKSQKTALIRA